MVLGAGGSAAGFGAAGGAAGADATGAAGAGAGADGADAGDEGSAAEEEPVSVDTNGTVFAAVAAAAEPAGTCCT
ncbi:MAG TPA: hypothetical protein VIK11_08105 [Tepidiformaceae bacterium]